MSTVSIPDDLLLRDRFTEIKPPLSPQAAVIEANRCLNCFDAPCTAACPTHIDVPGIYQAHQHGESSWLRPPHPRRQYSRRQLCKSLPC